MSAFCQVTLRLFVYNVPIMLEGEYRPSEVTEDGEKKENVVHPFAALQEQTQPEIIELLSTLYDAYTVHQQLQIASQQFPQETKASAIKHALKNYGSQVHLDPSFTERYRRASFFVEAAIHVMRGGFVAYPEDPSYLSDTISAAYEPYGFQVVAGRGEYNVESSAYHTRLVQQLENYAQSRRGARIPYTTLHYQIDDEYQWEPVGQWDEEPEVLLFTDHMNSVRNVQLQCYALKKENWFRRFRNEEKAENVAGLHPYYRERYSKAGDILQNVAEGVMRDGHAHDNYYWLHAMAYAFNEVLYDLDMHIDSNPDWQPGQSASLPFYQRSGGRTYVEEETNDTNTRESSS